jgi:hypothetical protein
MTNDLPPTRQAIAAKDRSGKLTVSGKLKVAIDLMLFEAASRSEAASKAGMTDHSLRAALRKSHVTAYYNQGLHVLRTSERARNISALARVRDTSENGMAVVSAAKALEQLAETESTAGRGSAVPVTPGMQLVIIQPSTPAVTPQTIDVTTSKNSLPASRTTTDDNE